MLVISRREGESIRIDDDIEIVIAHIGRKRVKVGVRAPRSMPVIAREARLVVAENQAAAAGGGRLAAIPEVLARLRPDRGQCG